MRKITLTMAVTAALLLPFAVPNALAGDAAHIKKGWIHISDDLKKALRKEMLAVQDGMIKLVPAIAGGDWAAVSRTADNIKKTYIMKQKLTKTQLKELCRALPEGFKRLDHRFHKTAGRLARAAERKDAELAVFYFYKLNEGCVTCHSTYAKQRFPTFNKTAKHHQAGPAPYHPAKGATLRPSPQKLQAPFRLWRNYAETSRRDSLLTKAGGGLAACSQKPLTCENRCNLLSAHCKSAKHSFLPAPSRRNPFLHVFPKQRMDAGSIHAATPLDVLT